MSNNWRASYTYTANKLYLGGGDYNYRRRKPKLSGGAWPHCSSDPANCNYVATSTYIPDSKWYSNLLVLGLCGLNLCILEATEGSR